MNRNELLQNLIALGYPIPDADGNLQAVVAPRTGTLADLMAVGDAGLGEVATMTDYDGQVVYGAGSVGKPYFRDATFFIASTSNSTTVSAPSGVDTVLPFIGAASNGATVDASGIILFNTDAYSASDKPSYIEVLPNMILQNAIVGGEYTLKLKMAQGAGAWWTVGRSVHIAVDTTDYFTSPIVTKSNSLSGYDRARLELLHSESSAVNVVGFDISKIQTTVRYA